MAAGRQTSDKLLVSGVEKGVDAGFRRHDEVVEPAMNRQERRRQAKTEPAAGLAQAYALYQSGDLAAAERILRGVLRRQPDEPDALRLLGELLADTGRSEEAIKSLRRLTQLQPAHFLSHYSLANAYRLAGRLDEAVEGYRVSLSLNAGFAGAHHGLGAALRALRLEAEAAECFARAAAAMPGWALAWQDLGLMRAVLGELAAAEAALRRAVTLDPRLGAAQRQLAALTSERPAADELARLRAQLERPGLAEADAIELLFALGRRADQAGDAPAAFGYFSQANGRLRAAQAQAGLGYDRAKLRDDVDRLMGIFTPSLFAAHAGWGDGSAAPVFILGMPRAGSSLFEQIAASHSQVFGAGEWRGIGEIAKRLGWRPSAAWTRESLGAAARDYLAGLRREAGGDAARMIDKMPDNIFQLGLIALLFPRARVIFCARDPRDVCLSCYFQHFSEPLGFDTDLADCAHRLREIERLAAHWRAVLPLRMMVLSYEALLADFEGQARGLIDFLGLAWEPGCLDFHETSRSVRTASWAQVRRPLYRSSCGNWRRYAALIPGLIAEFSEAGSRLAGPADWAQTAGNDLMTKGDD